MSARPVHASLYLAATALLLAGCATTNNLNAVSFPAADADASGELTFREFHGAMQDNAAYQQRAAAAGMSVRRYCGQDFTDGDSNSDGLLSSNEYRSLLASKT